MKVEKRLEVLMPQLGESVETGAIVKWYKKIGSKVEAGDLLLEVEGDKASMEIPATTSGTLEEILVQEGEEAAVGAPIAIIGSGQETSRPKKGEKLLSPAVRQLIKEHQLDIRQIPPSGHEGRVTKKDVLSYLTTQTAPPNNPEVETLPLNTMRKTIGKRMSASKTEIPHVAQAIEVNFEAVESAREKIKEDWKRTHGFSLTYLPFIIKSLCIAIKEYPLVNAWMKEDQLLVHRAVNMGVAVDLDFEGLVVPVLHHAHELSVKEIALQLFTLISKAKTQSLNTESYQGATYTISNPGGFGTLFTTAVINKPQVAIMSTDGIKRRPVVCYDSNTKAEAIGIKSMGILTQSFDHRAMDGAYSAAFLRRVVAIIEESDWNIH